jgi:hypothetical protein
VGLGVGEGFEQGRFFQAELLDFLAHLQVEMLLLCQLLIDFWWVAFGRGAFFDISL